MACRNATSKITVPIGLLLVFTAIWLGKALILGTRIFGGALELGTLRLAENDFPWIISAFIAGILSGYIRWRLLYRLVVSALALAAFWYGTDSVTLIHFDKHLYIHDIAKHWRAAHLIVGYLTPFHLLVAVVTVWVATLQVCVVFPPRHLVGLSAVTLLVGMIGHPGKNQLKVALTHYSFPPASAAFIPKVFSVQPLPYSTEETLLALSRSEQKRKVDLPPGNPDIILLVVESLSAMDSQAISGLHNRLPEMERIARDGKLFTNFFANYRSSEGALVALLTGSSPLVQTTSSRNLGRAFNSQPSVPRELRENGYQTEYLTTTELSFAEQGDFTHRIGFARVRGREEVKRFRQAPQFSFGAPSDEELYSQVIQDLSNRNESDSPLFLTLITSSSHPPYIDPRGRGDTEENVMNFVDAELGEFYDLLVRRGFFENGILIIVGDHHKHSPVTAPEIERYGDSAVARIPLVLVGSGVQRGVVDHRILDQSSLFSVLNAAASRHPLDSQPYVPYVHYVDPDSVGFFPTGVVADIMVFLQTEERIHTYPLHIEGRTLTWVGARPPAAMKVEESLHSERALSQYYSTARKTGCDSSLAPSPGLNAPASGFVLRAYRSGELRGELKHEALLSAKNYHVSNLDYYPGAWRQLTLPEDSMLEALATLNAPQAGKYRVRLEADDGACLAVDGQLTIDANSGDPGRLYEIELELAAGRHEVYVRYARRQREGVLRVGW